MLRADAAEWILSLVAPPSRAASTVGDLLESSRGAFWFWTSVVRTTVSFLCRHVMSNPAGIMLLALSGFARGLGCFGVYMVAMILLRGFANIIMTAAGIPDVTAYITEWPANAAGFVLWAVIVPFEIGGSLARRSPGRELAPCVAYAAAAQAAGSLLLSRGIRFTIGGVGVPFPNGSTAPYAVQVFVNVAWFLAIWMIPMFAGAIYVRRRSLRIPAR